MQLEALMVMEVRGAAQQSFPLALFLLSWRFNRITCVVRCFIRRFFIAGFISRDHRAAYMCVCVCVWLGLSCIAVVAVLPAWDVCVSWFFVSRIGGGCV